MATAKISGGLYRNAGGRGFHDGDGEPVELGDVPPELLTDAELAELAGEEEVVEEEDPQVAGSIEPADEGDAGDAEGEAGREPNPGTSSETTLPADFPGRPELVAAGLDTVEKVRACPDLSQVHGIGPKRLTQIAEALGG